MAKIIENFSGRKTIRLSTDDIISIVREYQNITYGINNYYLLRTKLNNFEIYLPEEII